MIFWRESLNNRIIMHSTLKEMDDQLSPIDDFKSRSLHSTQMVEKKNRIIPPLKNKIISPSQLKSYSYSVFFLYFPFTTFWLPFSSESSLVFFEVKNRAYECLTIMQVYLVNFFLFG